MDIINQIYNLRCNFIVIGLTGRTGSGCSTVAKILAEKDILKLKSCYQDFNSGNIDNNVRKNRIVYYFISKNWKPFTVIKASDVIFYYALMLSFEKFVEALIDAGTLENEKGKLEKVAIDTAIREALQKLKDKFELLSEKVKQCNEYLEKKQYKGDDNQIGEYKNLILVDIPSFRTSLSDVLLYTTKKVLGKELQNWGNNIRKYNSIVALPNLSVKSPSCLAHKINQFIKMFRAQDKFKNRPTLITIDALRNPYEILYFRERYSAFYSVSVNTEERIRMEHLAQKGFRINEIQDIDDEEKGKKDLDLSFEKIDIDKCIELSDIHITNGDKKRDGNRPLVNQLFTYVSLILHPGLVPPSSLERCMQIAYTAKLNSGCLSRQVGAAVTNEYYSVKSIGWNTVAEGQTPCSLRNIYDLIRKEDGNAFSNYEKSNDKFTSYVDKLVGKYNEVNSIDKLNGLTISYCFKDIHTTIIPKQKGNQVHTRSLHAEENAFLQLAKYGNVGIKGGKLFTTASCCELCAKKAYQLGIKEIYYIDAYPGISKAHILECGDNQPQMILFTGAVGRAYINLYNPFVPLKDEIEAITGINVKNLDSNNKQKKEGGKSYGDNNQN